MGVEITALVEANLEETYLSIREDSPAEWPSGARACWKRSGIEPIAQAVSLAPKNGPELESRQLVYGACRILFTVARRSAYVLDIRHSGRQPRRSGETPTEEP